jgi:hypothetical protein
LFKADFKVGGREKKLLNISLNKLFHLISSRILLVHKTLLGKANFFSTHSQRDSTRVFEAIFLSIFCSQDKNSPLKFCALLKGKKSKADNKNLKVNPTESFHMFAFLYLRLSISVCHFALVYFPNKFFLKEKDESQSSQHLPSSQCTVLFSQKMNKKNLKIKISPAK